MNYICTWFCADEKGEESHFPQTGKSSSSKEHQDIYWRCILVFFATSNRFNKIEKHVLFTNVKSLPVVDDNNVTKVLNKLNVEVVFTDFKYKTPKGYYGQFQNQFYEFSILEYIASNSNNLKDQYLILDSDCIFIKPVKELFTEATLSGFLSFKDDVKPDYVINGLSRNNLKNLFEILLNEPLSEIPDYHLGEFLLCSVENIKKIFNDFTLLWPQLLKWNAERKMKFNEEAHTLSFLYFKNNLHASSRKDLMKRIWTNPIFYRNVEGTDAQLYIWHLPSEKTFGIKDLYDDLLIRSSNFGMEIIDVKFIELAKKRLGVPKLSIRKRIEYYTLSYSRAANKRISSALRKIFISEKKIKQANYLLRKSL